MANWKKARLLEMLGKTQSFHAHEAIEVRLGERGRWRNES